MIVNSPLYLASQSPRRRELLEQAGIRFQVKVPQKEEKVAPKRLGRLKPSEIVRSIASAKALSATHELQEEQVPHAFVLAADTLVFFRGKVLGKPKHEEEAKKMLRSLAGNWHWVYTAVCVIQIKNKKIVKQRKFHIATHVKFFKLKSSWIDWYISTGEPMDKAGAYGAQAIGCTMIERISGSYTNVVGLPLGETIHLLEQMREEGQERWRS